MGTDMKYTYIDFLGTFPACNHIEGYDPRYNHGYAQGVTGEGIPFEAEHWSTDTEESITIVFPENFDMYEGIDPYADVFAEHKPDEPIPYQSQDILVDEGMLTVGMVTRERINNINVIMAYVDYFEDCGLFEFETEFRNGSLLQVTDKNGTDLLQLNITIWSENMGELATPDLIFKPFFPEKKEQHGKVLNFPEKRK